MSMDAGLVGWWRFNEKSGIIANDSSRYRNTGTLIGATLPVWAEKGIKFDGVNDYVNVGNAASLNITSAITIEAWVKRSATGVQHSIVEKYDLGSINGYLLRIQSNDKILVGILDASGLTYTSSVATISTGIWYHLVYVFSPGTNKIYINGNLDNSGVQNKVPTAGTTTLKIGASGGNPITPFNGSIDEVRIYNRALSAAEIKQNYEATKHKYI